MHLVIHSSEMTFVLVLHLSIESQIDFNYHLIALWYSSLGPVYPIFTGTTCCSSSYWHSDGRRWPSSRAGLTWCSSGIGQESWGPSGSSGHTWGSWLTTFSTMCRWDHWLVCQRDDSFECQRVCHFDCQRDHSYYKPMNLISQGPHFI